MPRIKHQIKEEHLHEMRSLVSYSFGKKIYTTSDCSELAQHIFEKVKCAVSTDTLRRFFGLIETNSQPSLFTMEILSKYVGFSGYYDFVDSVVLVGKHYLNRQLLNCISGEQSSHQALLNLKKCKPSLDYYSTLNQLILFAFHQKEKLFFEQVFNDQPGFEWISIFKYEIYQTIQLLGKLVEENLWLQEIAISNYVGLPYSFDYFVEWYVCDDSPYYDKLLENYYLTNVSNPEKVIFYNAIKALKHYRKNELKEFEIHAKALVELAEQTKTNNILKSRIIGVQFLLYFPEDNLAAEKKILEIDFEDMFPDIGDRVTSLFFLFNYLFESKSYSLMIALFERWVSHDAVFFSIWTRINWNQLCVFICFTYQKLGNNESASLYFTSIDPSLFEVYNKSRFQNIYIILEKEYPFKTEN